MVNWLFKKYPRPKRICLGCDGNFGLVRPHFPYCTKECQEKHRKKDQHELPLKVPERTTPC